MEKITQKQKQIIDMMKAGFRMLTTEGASYKCWLARESEKVVVSRASCEAMLRKGLITPAANSKSIFFEWKLKQ